MQLKHVSEPTNIFDRDNIANILSNKFIVGGFALYLISTIFWFGALSKLDISVLSPLGSMIFVMVALLAMVFPGEKVSPLRWTRIFVTIVGVVLLANSQGLPAGVLFWSRDPSIRRRSPSEKIPFGSVKGGLGSDFVNRAPFAKRGHYKTI
jgi:multidrug transporter EmrE-like cation transporter